MYLVYLNEGVKSYTFELPKIRKFVEQFSIGSVLNLYAGIVRLNLHEFRVDIDPKTRPDWVGDAYDFVTSTDKKFDTVILDPPYSARKAHEKYGMNMENEEVRISKFNKVKMEITRILNPYGRVITLGYDSTGMAEYRGFRKIAVAVVCHKGLHKDTLIVVDCKIKECYKSAKRQLDIRKGIKN